MSPTVSIPQAVGVVATRFAVKEELLDKWRFNTAGGRCCCNGQRNLLRHILKDTGVSIPQAVGVVATG